MRGFTRSQAPHRWAHARLDPGQYQRLGTYVESVTGIRMPPGRLTMLEGRLRSRLRALGMADFSEYCEHVFAGGGNEPELSWLLDRASTHTTSFFREAAHFTYLAREALPALRRAGAGGELFAWSAGCSTGEEAYTLAMVLSDEAARERVARPRILATDISHEVLKLGARAIYAEDRIEEIPAPLRTRYLLRSRDRETPTVRLVRELRELVTFQYLNLAEEHPALRPVDVLFCRNVLIYFDRATQEQVLGRLVRSLGPEGYLFLGHTDTIHGIDLPLQQMAPAVYRRRRGGGE